MEVPRERVKLEVKLKWIKGERSKCVNIGQSFQLCAKDPKNQSSGVSMYYCKKKYIKEKKKIIVKKNLTYYLIFFSHSSPHLLYIEEQLIKQHILC